MLRPPLALALLIGAGALGASAQATPAQVHQKGYDWEYANDARQVSMKETSPTASDHFAHVKFKRYGGVGQRQVRIGEKLQRPTGAWEYSHAVKLQVGERVVFTTTHPIACSFDERPVMVALQMRIRIPGKPWEGWTTWSVGTTYDAEDC